MSIINHDFLSLLHSGKQNASQEVRSLLVHSFLSGTKFTATNRHFLEEGYKDFVWECAKRDINLCHTGEESVTLWSATLLCCWRLLNLLCKETVYVPISTTVYQDNSYVDCNTKQNEHAQNASQFNICTSSLDYTLKYSTLKLCIFVVENLHEWRSNKRFLHLLCYKLRYF